MTKKAPAKASKIMGPVDYLVVKFPGNKFSGEILPELDRLEKSGIIRVIDMALVLKDTKGQVFVTEAKDVKGKEGDAFSAFAKIIGEAEWFSLDDIDAIAAGLPKNTLRLSCYSKIPGQSISRKPFSIQVQSWSIRVASLQK